MANRGPYRMYYSARISSSANTFTLVEDPGGGSEVEADLTVTAGRYWFHLDDSLDSSYPSLWLAMESAIAAGSFNNTYAFGSYNAGDNDLVNGNLFLQRTSGAASFRLEFSDADWSLNARHLGYDTTDNGGSDVDSSTGAIQFPYTPLGIWDSVSTDYGFDERRHPRSIEISSSRDKSVSYDNAMAEWTERKMRFQFLPGALLYGEHATDSGAASRAGVATGDINNGLIDLWELGRHDEILVTAEGDGDDFQIDASGNDYFVAKIADSPSFKANPVGQVGDQRGAAYETYELEFMLQELSGTYAF